MSGFVERMAVLLCSQTDSDLYMLGCGRSQTELLVIISVSSKAPLSLRLEMYRPLPTCL